MKDVKNFLFWIFLVLGVVLLIWNVFGNSPTEFVALVTLNFTILLKVWSVSDRQIKHEMRCRSLARDFKNHVIDQNIFNEEQRNVNTEIKDSIRQIQQVLQV
tara:strand:- start:4106 stop:4411 length:306 start_codon:yes stop_codon:yes gene_type:complete